MRTAICDEHDALLELGNAKFISTISEVRDNIETLFEVAQTSTPGKLSDVSRWKKYVDAMRLDYTWGSSLEIRSTASILDREIQL
jgi:hypothetical protein